MYPLPLYDPYDDHVGETTTQEVERLVEAERRFASVSDGTNIKHVCRPVIEAQRLFERLKAKLDKARAAADAFIGEDRDDFWPPAVRQILIQKNSELESMNFEIDHLVARGEYSSLDTAVAKRNTMELATKHKTMLRSFVRVRRSILKFEADYARRL